MTRIPFAAAFLVALAGLALLLGALAILPGEPCRHPGTNYTEKNPCAATANTESTNRPTYASRAARRSSWRAETPRLRAPNAAARWSAPAATSMLRSDATASSGRSSTSSSAAESASTPAGARGRGSDPLDFATSRPSFGVVAPSSRFLPAEVAARLAMLERMHERAAEAGYRLAEVERVLPGVVAAEALALELFPEPREAEEMPGEWTRTEEP